MGYLEEIGSEKQQHGGSQGLWKEGQKVYTYIMGRVSGWDGEKVLALELNKTAQRVELLAEQARCPELELQNPHEGGTTELSSERCPAQKEQ